VALETGKVGGRCIRGRAGVGWRELIAVMMLEESVMYVPEGRRMVGIV